MCYPRNSAGTLPRIPELARLVMKEIPTGIDGLTIIERKKLLDDRGFLERMFCTSDFRNVLESRAVCQVNHTLTKKAGTVRGLHFQHPPFAETKLVSCIKGSVFDVALDIRKDSDTFLQYFSITLTAEDPITLCIPEGFAHGFQTLEPDCEMLYFHTAPYNAESEGAINALDPLVNVAWPLPVSERSERDTGTDFISEKFQGVPKP